MMIPIVIAVLNELQGPSENIVKNEESRETNRSFDDEEKSDEDKEEKDETDFTDKLSARPSENSLDVSTKSTKQTLSSTEIGLILSVPYASSVGGTATLTGTALELEKCSIEHKQTSRNISCVSKSV